MQISIVIEALPGNRFRATSASALPLIVEANSAEESLRLWRERYASVIPSDAEVVAVEQPVHETHAFAKYIGTLKTSDWLNSDAVDWKSIAANDTGSSFDFPRGVAGRSRVPLSFDGGRELRGAPWGSRRGS